MRLQAALRSFFLVTALAALVAVVALSYGHGVILAHASRFSFGSPVNVTPPSSYHPSTSSWTATFYSSIPGFADYSGGFSFTVGNDNMLYGSGTIKKTYYVPGCPSGMIDGDIAVKGYVDASNMVYFQFSVTRASNGFDLTCSGTTYHVYGATDGFADRTVSMSLTNGATTTFKPLDNIDSTLPDYIQITLQGSNTYDVSVSLSGVPGDASANVWLDGVNQGTIGGAETKTLTISLTSISHTITVDQYLTAPDGTRYYCAQNTLTVNGAGSYTFTYEIAAGTPITSQQPTTTATQPASSVDYATPLVTIALIGGGGYLLYNRYYKKKEPPANPCAPLGRDLEMARAAAEDQISRLTDAARELSSTQDDLTKLVAKIKDKALLDLGDEFTKGAISQSWSTKMLLARIEFGGYKFAEKYVSDIFRFKGLLKKGFASFMSGYDLVKGGYDAIKGEQELLKMLDTLVTEANNIEEAKLSFPGLLAQLNRARDLYNECLKTHATPTTSNTGGDVSMTDEAGHPCGEPAPRTTITTVSFSQFYDQLPGASSSETAIGVGSNSKVTLMKEPTGPVPWLRLPEASQVRKWQDLNVIKMDSGKLGLNYAEGEASKHAVLALPEQGWGAAPAPDTAVRWLAHPKGTRLLAEGTRYGSAVGVLKGEVEFWSSGNPEKVYTVRQGELAIARPGQPPEIISMEFEPDMLTKTGELKGSWWYLPPLVVLPPKIAGGVTCPSCHRTIGQNLKFCTYCGTKLATQEQKQVSEPEPPKQETVACSSCGRRISPKLKFCTYCGTKVEAAQPGKEGYVFCTECGKRIPSSLKFCAYCGRKLGAA